MNHNDNKKPASDPIKVEKLLAQVRLRQPELDVEAIIREGIEQPEYETRPVSTAPRRPFFRPRFRRRLRIWATLTSVWATGVTAGILFMYFYVGSSLQTARAELQSVKQTQAQLAKLLDEQSQSQEQPNVPAPVAPSKPDRSTPSPQQENEQPGPYRFLVHLNRPGPIDYIQLFNSTRHMPPCKPCVYRVPNDNSTDAPDAERSPEIKPYKPQPPKTQQQLFQEVLKDLNV